MASTDDTPGSLRTCAATAETWPMSVWMRMNAPTVIPRPNRPRGRCSAVRNAPSKSVPSAAQRGAWPLHYALTAGGRQEPSTTRFESAQRDAHVGRLQPSLSAELVDLGVGSDEVENGGDAGVADIA